MEERADVARKNALGAAIKAKIASDQLRAVMRVTVGITLLLCCSALAVCQSAKASLCGTTGVSTTDHVAGVTVQKLTLNGKWGTNDAIAYVPDKEIVDGAVLISHSTIHADSGGSVDLGPFAMTLARAGAAVVVVQRTLMWPPTDRSANREGAPAICAEYWLVDHTKVFNNGEPTVNEVSGNNIVVREGYAYVGPRLCDPTVVSDCEFTDPFVFPGDCDLKHYCRQSVWVPIGETAGADGTTHFLSDAGFWTARWLQRQLKLAPIEALVSPTSASVR